MELRREGGSPQAPLAGFTGPSLLPEPFVRALRELGLGEVTGGQALTGGVSSDIWRIDTDAGSICAKRALPTLRVAAEWHAPVERNVYEARWMRVANEAVPGIAPAVLGQHEGLGVLAMQWLSPADHVLWKHQLRDGVADPRTAAAVGRALGRIHAFSAARPALAAEFATDAIFFDIRLAPYLLATAQRHPVLAEALRSLVEATRGHRVALVHGDVSPKNILIGPHGPVLLDAECAWWGDPAFDLAFCLNHLLLKCVWTPQASAGYLACFDTLVANHLAQVDWEPRDALERRAAALLPGLLLARVDGKSPVEYITEDTQRDRVRRAAVPLLQRPMPTLADVARAWKDSA